MREAAQAALDAGNVGEAARAARRAVEEFLQEACAGLGAKLAFRRGFENDRREIGQLIGGLEARLKSLHPSTGQVVGPLLSGIKLDVEAALNVESHASTGRAAMGEVAVLLERLDAVVAHLTCGSCGSRKWKQGQENLYACKCGASILSPSVKGGSGIGGSV